MSAGTGVRNNKESDRKCTECCSPVFDPAHDAVEATGKLVIFIIQIITAAWLRIMVVSMENN